MRRTSLSPDTMRNSPTPDSELGSYDARNTPVQRHSPRSRPTSGFTNKARAARNANTPINEMSRADRRFWPKDTRCLLEICEQGYQLQQGMKTHCKETADAMEDLTGACENNFKLMLGQMETTLQRFQKEYEKPVNVDWTPMTNHLQNLQDEVVKTMASEHQDAIGRLEGQLAGRIAERLDELSSRSQRLEDVQNGRLEEIREELRNVQSASEEMRESVKSSQAQFESFVVEQNQSWKNAKSLNTEIHGIQERMAKRIANIEPQVEKVLAHEVNARHDELIKEIHDTVHSDLLQLFHEVGKIQRELNIDFVAPPNKSKTQGSNLTRLREMWAQTEHVKLTDSGCQVDTDLIGPLKKGKKKKKRNSVVATTLAVPKALATDAGPKKKKNIFADEEQMKAKMRAQLIRPEYNVTHYYYASGCAQAIARSQYFEHLTFFVIVVNALWLAVDTDMNDAVVLVDASPVFQVSENVFCTYFFVELVIRFLAFRRKKYCCRDFWFIFDSLLVAGMVLETWILTVVLLIFESDGWTDRNVGHFSLLRIARLVKLFRMARMARILRMVPELLFIVRGIGAAIRSVAFFILLTMIIIYVFAVFFRQVTRDTPLEQQYFSSVPGAMNSLVFDAMLPLYSQVVSDIMQVDPALYPAIVFFILLASVTVLNMLTGVLVEIVRTVAATEKEGMTVTHVTQQLKEVMDSFQNGPRQRPSDPVGHRGSRVSAMLQSVIPIASMKSEAVDVSSLNLLRRDFEHFLMQPDVGRIIHEVGVDVLGLIDMADMIYEDKDTDGKGLTFSDFIDVVLNMRGNNPSTVKDVKQQIRIMKTVMKDTSDNLHRQMVKDLNNLHLDVMQQLIELRKAQIRGDSDDGESIGDGSGASRSGSNFFDLKSRTVTSGAFDLQPRMSGVVDLQTRSLDLQTRSSNLLSMQEPVLTLNIQQLENEESSAPHSEAERLSEGDDEDVVSEIPDGSEQCSDYQSDQP